MDEIWKSVIGYDGHYEVSNLGRIRSLDKMVKTVHGSYTLRRGRILAKAIDLSGAGYAFANLSKDGRARKFNVHVIVLEAFVGQRPEGMQACHGNGDRTDPRLENLRWDTAKANAGDREIHGTTFRGESSCNAKLTMAQVDEIRKSKISSLKLAGCYGVASSTIRAVRLHVNWRNA